MPNFRRFGRLATLVCLVAAPACSNDRGADADVANVTIEGSDAEGADASAPDHADDAAVDGDAETIADSGRAGTDVGSEADVRIDPRWAAVQAELEAAFADNPMGAGGMTLIVHDESDRRVFESTVGDFDPDRRIAVASASKLVSGLVLMRLIGDGNSGLALNTTIGEVLDDWLGEQGLINLDQLGAFTSGLPPEAPCLRQSTITLEECVAELAALTLSDAPGSDFAYGSTHLQVAARVAEVATGKTWQTLFDEQLATPLGVADPELRYVTFPRRNVGTTNPLVAGGLRATTNEYVEFLRLLFHRGTVNGAELISANAMGRFRQNLYVTADINSSPLTGSGYDFRYGWASWLECEGAVATCDVVSSPGAFGFTPWVDYENGYYAVLAMEASESGAGIEATIVAQRLRPLIVAALP